MGETDHNSLLLHQAEAQSVANRSDAKVLLLQLVDDSKMSNDHVNSLEKCATFFR